MINMVNLYLDDNHKEQRAKIQSADPKDTKLLQGYAREAFRKWRTSYSSSTGLIG